MRLNLTGALKPLIDHKIAFSEIAEGLQAFADGRVRGRHFH